MRQNSATAVPAAAARMSVKNAAEPPPAAQLGQQALGGAGQQRHRGLGKKAAEQPGKAGAARRRGRRQRQHAAGGQRADVRQAGLGAFQIQFAGGQLTRKLVHRLHPAQMDGGGRHVADLAAAAGRDKDAVCQHIDVELADAQALGHDLHCLLDAEHLAAVFQQRAPRVDHQQKRPVMLRVRGRAARRGLCFAFAHSHKNPPYNVIQLLATTSASSNSASKTAARRCQPGFARSRSSTQQPR